MRHLTIVLTMDTYGYLFPGQEVDEVAQMRRFLFTNQPETLQATGTDTAAAASTVPDGAQSRDPSSLATKCRKMEIQDAIRRDKAPRRAVN